MNHPARLILAAAVTTLPLSLNAQVVVTPSDGFTIAWDGNDGDGFNPESPAPAPANLANGVGAVPFTSSDLGLGIHIAPHLNDGLYGNSNSWIGGDGTPDPYAAIRLPGLATITSFAFGRDNGNSVADACGGQCADRSLGLYTIQITRVSVPDESTLDTGDATTGWQTIGTLEYVGNEDTIPGEGFTSFLRHEYEIAQAATPIQATGFRILVPGTGIGPQGTAIDEIELYGPGVVDPDKDGDGFDDTVEEALGTDPNNPASTPESISNIRTAVEFSFWAAKNKKYTIESSPDLVNWTSVETDITGRGAEITRLYSITGQSKLHYRSVRQ
jgi:hypothetical protein